MRVDLPTWAEISHKVDRGDDLTKLEQFIYDNEPASNDKDEDVKWRESLRLVFQEFIEELLCG